MLQLATPLHLLLALTVSEPYCERAKFTYYCSRQGRVCWCQPCAARGIRVPSCWKFLIDRDHEKVRGGVLVVLAFATAGDIVELKRGMEKVGVGRKDGSDGSDAVDGSVREDDSDAGDEKRPPIDMPSASKEGDSAERRRHLLLGFAFLYTTLFSGALFGWGPMQLLLEENGSFSSKCSDEEQAAGEICPSQSASLVKLHFIALLSQVCSPILGELLDRYGPAFISYLMAVSAWVGLGLLIVAAQTNVDEILFAAFIGIALSTWMVSSLTCSCSTPSSAPVDSYSQSPNLLVSYGREDYSPYRRRWSFKDEHDQGLFSSSTRYLTLGL